MKKLAIITLIVLMAVPALAQRKNVWRVHINQMYRNARGVSAAKITITLAKAWSQSTLLNVDVCGVTGDNKKVCTEINGGKRMRSGDSVRMTVEFPRTKYPVERIYIDD